MSDQAWTPGSSIPIPIPTEVGDKGEYFLLDVQREGNLLRTLHKRIGVEHTGYSITLIDPVNERYHDVAYCEEPETTPIPHTDPFSNEWVDLVGGSSKYHLVSFIIELMEG